MNSKEIREKYLAFFKARHHSVIPSASLIPENDSTLLFVNSGMFPLVPYLLGAKHPAGNCLVNSQKSFRSEDIDEVGDNRHNTFFEMLGNWSLGSDSVLESDVYWKGEQLNWWYEFLIDELKLDPKRLYQTVYIGSEDGTIPHDTESIEIMLQLFAKYGLDVDQAPDFGSEGPVEDLELGKSKYHIFAYRNKNWWQRGDAVGELGGPDSETFYDTGKIHDEKFGKYCHPNCDCGRFIEIGNSVFMQYQKTASGWQELKNKNVDFGGGLERLCMVTQEKANIFQTDLFNEAILKIEELSGKKYEEDNKSFEIIADHLKAATFIMGDEKGIAPSNTDQGYIVRRLIRRALRFAKVIGITAEDWTKNLAQIYINFYQEIYPELKKNQAFVIEQLSKEEKKFITTLEKGEKEFTKYLMVGVGGKSVFDGEKILPGEVIFNLYASFGYPIEMIEEIAKEKGLSLDVAGYEDKMIEHKNLSRTASAGKFKGGLADHSEETTKLHTASHLLLAALRQILGPEVSQRGSNITAERLRFDFPYSSKMTEEQIKQVEDLVNEAIDKKLPVHCEEMSLDKAREIGATGVFDSKYGDQVKVYFIGHEGDYFSKEICGGPHVENTAELHHFKIIKEESSSSGIRRIRASLD